MEGYTSDMNSISENWDTYHRNFDRQALALEPISPQGGYSRPSNVSRTAKLFLIDLFLKNDQLQIWLKW